MLLGILLTIKDSELLKKYIVYTWKLLNAYRKSCAWIGISGLKILKYYEEPS